jgi:predicted NUDIX family phosphoesterase
MITSVEKVLAITRSILDKVCPNTFNHNTAEARAAFKGHTEFIARNLVETDFTRKQIIPYVLAKCGDKYLCIQRTSKQTESRLHNKYGLGVGGHINDEDQSPDQDIIDAGMRRELNEEIQFPDEVSCKLVGIINDDTLEVDRVHTGFVYVLESSTETFDLQEKDQHLPSWKTIAELTELEPLMESWAKVVFHNVIKAAT